MNGDFGAILKDSVEIETQCLTWVFVAMFTKTDISCSMREGAASRESSKSRVGVARPRRVGNAKFYVFAEGWHLAFIKAK